MKKTIKEFDKAREEFIRVADELSNRCREQAMSVSDSSESDYLKYASAAMGGAAMGIADHSIMGFEVWKRTMGGNKSLD